MTILQYEGMYTNIMQKYSWERAVTIGITITRVITQKLMQKSSCGRQGSDNTVTGFTIMRVCTQK